MCKRAFSLAELIIALGVVSVGLLSISGAVVYSTRTGAQAARQTQALQYAKQLIQLSKLYNLPRVSPINDPPSARVAVAAAPFAGNIQALPDYTRNIRMTQVSAVPTDHRSQLYRIDVIIYWWDRGRELSLTDSAIHRSP